MTIIHLYHLHRPKPHYVSSCVKSDGIATFISFSIIVPVAIVLLLLIALAIITEWDDVKTYELEAKIVGTVNDHSGKRINSKVYVILQYPDGVQQKVSTGYHPNSCPLMVYSLPVKVKVTVTTNPIMESYRWDSTLLTQPCRRPYGS